MTVGLNAFLMLSGFLFALGFSGLLWQRHVVIMLICLELMLNAINLALVSFSRYHATFDVQSGMGHHLMDGNLLVFFITTVAAVEVALGLALIVALYRRRGTIRIDALNALHD